MDELLSEASTARLAALLEAHNGFGAFEPAVLASLEAELERVTLPAGATLFQHGDPGDAMYVLLRGLLRVTMPRPDGTESSIDILDPGASVGEMALLTGQTRTATVQALNDAELVKLSKVGFDRLATEHPAAMRRFARSIVPRWQRTQLLSVLSDLFGPLDASALHDIQEALEWRHLAGGETLVRQGDPGDAMFVVVNGRLRITVQGDDDRDHVIGEVGRGETIGEFALMTGEPRSATVIAIRDTDVVRLTQDVFQRLSAQYPQAMLQINRILVRRTQRSLRGAESASVGALTLALVPVRPDVPVGAFAQHLVTALGGGQPVLHLSSQRFDELYGKPHVAQTDADDPTDVSLVGWLTEQELMQRVVVYEADASWSAWTRRCLRQADRVVLVAEASTDPTPGPLEAILREHVPPERCELVLLQPDAILRPHGTSRWLDARSVGVHHHVRLNHGGDMARVARRLTGRAVALVFSGGGARGFAHVGVLRALEEAGVEVDLLAGTSMGGLIAAMAVIGADHAKLAEVAATFGSPKQLLDRTLPFAALMSSAKVTALYRHLFHDVRIEDAWRPFFCVSSDLTRAEPVIHDRGPLWEAVRASTAIPGIFTPFLHEGHVLVDGAVMNHFPIDLMRQRLGGGILVAVDASPRTDKLTNYTFGPSVSGWQILRSKVLPWGSRLRVPSILHTLMRSIEINSIYRLPEIAHQADMIIRPPVERFRTLDFAAHQEIITVGYDAAREPVAALRAQLAR